MPDARQHQTNDTRTRRQHWISFRGCAQFLLTRAKKLLRVSLRHIRNPAIILALVSNCQSSHPRRVAAKPGEKSHPGRTSNRNQRKAHADLPKRPFRRCTHLIQPAAGRQGDGESMMGKKQSPHPTRKEIRSSQRTNCSFSGGFRAESHTSESGTKAKKCKTWMGFPCSQA